MEFLELCLRSRLLRLLVNLLGLLFLALLFSLMFRFFVLLALFALSAVAFAVALSPLFKSARIASIVTSVIFFMTVFVKVASAAAPIPSAPVPPSPQPAAAPAWTTAQANCAAGDAVTRRCAASSVESGTRRAQ